MIQILYFYWFMAAVLGNKFIKFSIFRINTFYILIGVCIIYSLNWYRSFSTYYFTSQPARQFYKCLKGFFWLVIFYIFLSFFNFFVNLFRLDDLIYNKSFIFRHSYFFIVFPVVLSVVSSGDRSYKFIIDRKTNIIFFILLILFRYIFGWDRIVYRTLSFALASMIFIQNPKSIISASAMIFAVFSMISISYYSSSVLAFVMAILCYFLFDNLMTFFRAHNSEIKFWILALLGLFLVVIVTDNVFGKDKNAMWRWAIWINEFDLIKRSFLIGVGFGTGYASNSIYFQINNPSVFFTQASEEGAGLFVIPQHNSFLNLIYRTGIIGLILGCYIFIILPLSWASQVIMELDLDEKVFMLVKWGIINLVFNTIIILTNPGLESPRFLIGYIIPFGILIGSLVRADKNIEEKML